jgi:hypothetical protein
MLYKVEGGVIKVSEDKAKKPKKTKTKSKIN